MAFEFISIERIIRKSEQEPNYNAVIKYNRQEIYCDIYTNILILDKGKMFCNKVDLSTELNGDFYFRLEVLDSWHREYEKHLEKEIIGYARNQNETDNK